MHDTAPTWQCPSCGIAYSKYETYLSRAKSMTEPRTVKSGRAPVTLDGSVWALVSANVMVVLIAILQGWRLVDMMLVYWIQSVVIGISYVLRIGSLDRFSTENFSVNNKPVEPTPETKRHVAIFFACHYGGFHLAYIIILLSGEFGDPRLGPDLLFCGLVFAVNHYYSYQYHRALDEKGSPNIGTMMFVPYARIVPMHLVIVLGNTLGGGSGVFIFGTLKTVADAIMHQVEHRLLSDHA